MWSGTLADVLGVDPNAFTSDPYAFTEIIHPDDRQDHRDRIVAAAQAGADFQNEVRVVRMDGEERWLEVRGRTVVDARNQPIKMIGIAADVTERRLVEDVRGRLLEREHQWRIEAEAARERLAVLSEASPILIATLDPRTVMQRVPSLVVPRLGDWCIVDMLDDDGELTEVTTLHRDPSLGRRRPREPVPAPRRRRRRPVERPPRRCGPVRRSWWSTSATTTSSRRPRTTSTSHCSAGSTHARRSRCRSSPAAGCSGA